MNTKGTRSLGQPEPPVPVVRNRRFVKPTCDSCAYKSHLVCDKCAYYWAQVAMDEKRADEAKPARSRTRSVYYA
jgi:hypothetical protein